MARYYAGIGSRQTPHDVLELMERTAARLAREGWTLRSGGAQGADTAFENGCTNSNGAKQIFLPWRGFNGRGDKPFFYPFIDNAALAMAAQFHPAWDRCSAAAKKLHARNCYQVLGSDLATPSELVICWTPGGLRGGGTGQALRIAAHHGIPIHDLAIAKVREAYERKLAG